MSGPSLFTALEYQDECFDWNGDARGAWAVLAVTFTLLAVPLLPSLLPGKDLRLGP